MTKNFPTTQVVIATVSNIPSDQYFFCKNGDPHEIMCHKNCGGTLTLTQSGRVVLKQDEQTVESAIGDKIVLVRASEDEGSRDYTKAFRWAPFSDWQNVLWTLERALKMQTTFRAVAFNHRTNQHTQSNALVDQVLKEGKLADLINEFHGRDPFGKQIECQLGSTSLVSDVRWEKKCADGKWTECRCPLS